MLNQRPASEVGGRVWRPRRHETVANAEGGPGAGASESMCICSLHITQNTLLYMLTKRGHVVQVQTQRSNAQ